MEYRLINCGNLHDTNIYRGLYTDNSHPDKVINGKTYYYDPNPHNNKLCSKCGIVNNVEHKLHWLCLRTTTDIDRRYLRHVDCRPNREPYWLYDHDDIDQYYHHDCLPISTPDSLFELSKRLIDPEDLNELKSRFCM